MVVSAKALGVAEALVDGTRVPGDVVVEAGVVTAVGVQPAGRSGLAVPGFVDVQVNGFAGVDLTTADLDGYRAASLALGRTGVTSFLATIPTAAPDSYGPALAVARDAAAADLPGSRVVGVHLEGPFLSRQRPGAHRPDWLRDPDLGLCDAWLDAAPVALMTVAPELDGALELIEHLCARRVVVSLGHTDARAEAAHRGFDAGASMVTHLWNAQRPITSREPAVGGAALARHDVAVGLIADLIHVADDTLRFSIAAAGPRFMLITDAVWLAGTGEVPGAERSTPAAGTGRSLGVTLVDGAVRLPDGTLAGSACSMDQAVRNVVGLGVPLEQVIAAATSTPARALRTHGVGLGRLAPGGRADIAVLDDALEVRQVLVAGREI
ncbi:MAG: N-acetylglucosamine-6-phosphate deacetylase [Acidimicrobiales bacterium]